MVIRKAGAGEPISLMQMHNPVHPGEFIEGVSLEPCELSIRQVAERLGVSASTLQRLVVGKSRASPDMALRLSRVLGRSAESWLAMQAAGGCGMSSTAVKLSQLSTVKQAQQSLEFAAIVGGGVELEGKSASIKSISECIQLSNASSFSSCILRCSATGSRRQLSIRNKERKGESDEPDAPLLLERELAVGEVDVVIGRKKRDQANNAADDGFQQGFSVKPQAPPGRRGIKIPKIFIHPKQPTPIAIATSIVRLYSSATWWFRPCPPPTRQTFSPCSPAAAASW
jgi:addiction module HigA family antidote